MTEEQIKTINDTVSAIVMYERDELGTYQFMRCLRETIGLPEECINHIETLIISYYED
jgi:hypothetical protein